MRQSYYAKLSVIHSFKSFGAIKRKNNADNKEIFGTVSALTSEESYHKHFVLGFKNVAQQEMSNTNTASEHGQCCCVQS